MRIDTTAVHIETMSVGAVIMIRNKRASGVVTIDGLALFFNNTSDS